MKLIDIEISQLFNKYSYTIDLSKNQDISIITGPNGYGKSTLLRMINYIFSGNIYPLFDINFKLLSVNLKDNNNSKTNLKIERNIQANSETQLSDIGDFSNIYLLFTLNDKADTAVAISKEQIEEKIQERGIVKGEDNNWWKKGTAEYYSPNEVFKIISTELKSLFERSPDIYMLLGGLESSLISDQRLYMQEFINKESSKSIVLFNKAQVVQDALGMKENIRDLRKLFTENLNKFMLEALSNPKSNLTDSADTKKQTDEINKRIDVLVRFGIINKEQHIPNLVNTQTLSAILIYSYEETLKLIQNRVDKLLKFEDIITKSAFADKTLKIDASNGFSFFDDKGVYIQLENLSSGEQHKLIIWYHLLFRTKPGVLVLIDEPELSFHVIWQTSFVQELQQVITDLNLQAIVATHSPQIIDGKWSMTTDLYELSNKTL